MVVSSLDEVEASRFHTSLSFSTLPITSPGPRRAIACWLDAVARRRFQYAYALLFSNSNAKSSDGA